MILSFCNISLILSIVITIWGFCLDDNDNNYADQDHQCNPSNADFHFEVFPPHFPLDFLGCSCKCCGSQFQIFGPGIQISKFDLSFHDFLDIKAHRIYNLCDLYMNIYIFLSDDLLTLIFNSCFTNLFPCCIYLIIIGCHPEYCVKLFLCVLFF